MIDSRWVSVIVPVYNGAKYIAEALESVLAQTFRPIEIIVVDDDSTDDTASIVQQYAAPVRYVKIPHGGIAAARNHGIDLARGEFIAFLDADDVWTPDKLALQMTAFDQNPGIEMVFGYVRQFISPDLSPDLAQKIDCPSVPMPGYIAGTMLTTRVIFQRLGYFQIDYQLAEFIDWYAKAVEEKVAIMLLPQVVLFRRLHSTNQGVSKRDQRDDYVRVVKAALDRRRQLEAKERNQ